MRSSTGLGDCDGISDNEDTLGTLATLNRHLSRFRFDGTTVWG
jgi:hypothetical protein